MDLEKIKSKEDFKVKVKLKLIIICVLLIFSIATFMGIASEFPEKDIRMIFPWGAGGGGDAITRMISKIAEKPIPVSIYVENITGAMSGNGLLEVMRAKPDGYTLGIAAYDSVISVPWKKLVPGYDLEKLTLICRLTSEADALIVAKDSRFKTFDDLINAAKEEPGQINVAIQNLGSRQNIAMLMFEDKFGVKFNQIAYTGGSGPQKEALLSGETEVICTSLGDFAPIINSGNARGLVEFSEKRNVKFSDVPTLKELGHDFVIGSFIAVAVPSETPAKILAELEKIFDDAYHTDEFLDWLNEVGVTSAWLNSEEVNQWVKEIQTKYFGILDMLVEQGIIEE